MSAALALILTKAFQLFLVLDSIGNTGIIAMLTSGFGKERQRYIIMRETLFSLAILVVVFFSGSYFLQALDISQAAITITGGIVFLLFSISLLFPGSSMVTLKNLDEEPFLVPIAIPLVVGPSSIATVIILAHNKDQWLLSLIAVFLAWVATGIIILMGPYLLEKMGNVGILVVERMIGMLAALISVKMLLKGAKLFVESLALVSQS